MFFSHLRHQLHKPFNCHYHYYCHRHHYHYQYYLRAMSTTTTASASAASTAATSSASLSKKSIAEKIAARVQERDSWPTSHTHTPMELFKFISKYGPSLPKLPSQKQLDEEFPVQAMDWPKVKQATTAADYSSSSSSFPMQVTWIGHATCLIQMGGYTILTDPIFSHRCSAVQFAGPARYRPPACTCEELLEQLSLPPAASLDVVVISHNHYDHLDYYSIKDLSQKSKKPLTFIVPLGLAKWFQNYISGFEKKGHKVIELDWHESYTFHRDPTETNTTTGKDDGTNTNTNGLVVTAIPMQHWSSRRGWDRDQTLWCGFTFKTTTTTTTNHDDNNKHHQTALFPGDTGWFEGLYDIGTTYGPFDVAMIPIGAYEPREFMKFQHTNPSDAVKMMMAIQAKKALPIHWGTFQLTKEHYLEPREKLAEAVKEAGLEPSSFDSWLIGETVTIDIDK